MLRRDALRAARQRHMLHTLDDVGGNGDALWLLGGATFSMLWSKLQPTLIFCEHGSFTIPLRTSKSQPSDALPAVRRRHVRCALVEADPKREIL